MQKKVWVIAKTDDEKVKEISNKYNISELVAKLILNRKDFDDIDDYINSDIERLYDPFMMKDMELATKRIITSINNKEKIVIYGDYDVDGVTSITTLYCFLKERGAIVDYYLPNRLEEGYGLNKEALLNIKDEGAKLVITVDCGISAFEEVQYAKDIGLSLIITDHHECKEEVPNALAIVNPKQKICKYPFKQLAGVGVAFKLITAIAKTLGLENESYLKYLDIVSVGTIADIVPLVDENRIIAKCGIEKVKETKNIGLKRLLEVSGFSYVDSTVISFGIAPKINACGRMENANKAVELLLETDIDKANKIANELNEINKLRQEIEKKIYKEAIEIIERENLDKNEVIVLGKDGWHHGVIGIVASKLTDLYYKPTILFSFEDEVGKGSGRSIQGLSLYETLTDLSQHLIQFGGHELAAGISINKSNFIKFKDSIEQYILDIIHLKRPPEINIDSEITLNDLTIDTINQLDLIKPYGQNNPYPIFIYNNVKVDSIRVLGDGKHLKISFKDKNSIIDGIGFNMGARRDEIVIGDRLDVVCIIEINEFNGLKKVQLNIKDFQKVR